MGFDVRIIDEETGELVGAGEYELVMSRVIVTSVQSLGFADQTGYIEHVVRQEQEPPLVFNGKAPEPIFDSYLLEMCDWEGCVNVLTVQVAGSWFCEKHAAIVTGLEELPATECCECASTGKLIEYKGASSGLQWEGARAHL